MKALKPTLSHYIFELVVVVAGISLAFMVDRYREEFKKEDLRASYTKQLIKDIQLNKKRIDTSVDYSTESLKKINSIAKILVRKDYQNDSIKYAVYSLLTLQNIVPQTSSYESMKATGNLDLIENLKLQGNLSELFTSYNLMVDINNIFNSYSNQFILPYLHKNFDFIEGLKATKRFNPADLEFRNIISGYIALLTQSIDFMKKCSKSSEELLIELDSN